jgi:hypothetical protein
MPFDLRVGKVFEQRRRSSVFKFRLAALPVRDARHR